MTLCFCVITGVLLWVFVKHRDTPIVKANIQAFSYVLFISLRLCFLCSLLFIGHPQTAICILQQIIFGASLIAQLVKNPPAMQETQVNSWVGKIHWRRERLPTPVFLGFPCGPAGKESTCNVGDLGLIPGLGRSPREGKGYPLQYSGLENSMECIVHGVTKSQTRLSDFHFTSLTVTVATVLAKTLTVILAFKTRKPRTTMTQLLVTGAANYVIPMCSLIQVIICGVCWKALSLSLRWAHSEHKELLMCATRAQSLPSTVSWDSWAP